MIVTPGGKQALFEATLAFVEPGVDVLIPEPAWVSYGPMVELAGGTSRAGAARSRRQLATDRRSPRRRVRPPTRILLINSPNNPTGRVLDDEELAAIAAFRQGTRPACLLRRDVREDPLRRHQHISIATLPGMAERTLIFNGLSKAYAMTGWRLGYVAGPRPYMDKSKKCTATPSPARRRSCRRPASPR